MIKRVDGKFVLFSRDGKRRLGSYDTKSAALRREIQVKQFMRKKAAAETTSDAKAAKEK